VEIHSSAPKVEKAEKRGAEFALWRTGQSAVLRKPGYKETAQTLREELLFQRAVQTYLWALPLINTFGMKVGSEKVFGAVSLPIVLTFAEGILEHSAQ